MSGDASGFAAYAFHPTFGEEAVPGRIVFEHRRLRFVAETFAVEMPVAQLEIAKGDDSRIYFSDPNQPDWSVYTFDGRIFRCRALAEQPHTRHQIKALQSVAEFKRRLKVTAGVLAGFALLALMVSTAMSFMVRALVARIPPKWEQEVGDKALQEIKQEVTFIEDPKLMARVIAAVAPLTNALPQGGIENFILRERMPNAFALPGGHVLITTALLDLADKPEEIAGVVAHEVAHVTQKHGFRRIIAAAGPYLICRVFVSERGGLLGVLGGSSEFLIRQSFSQEYELEADAVGWDSLVAAHIDPRGMIEMFHKLDLWERNTPEAQAMIGAFSSHPATEKRIQRLEAKWKRLKDKGHFLAYEEAPAP